MTGPPPHIHLYGGRWWRMALFAAVGCAVALLGVVAVLGALARHRARLTQMAAMMVAMCLGMLTGILGGMGAVSIGMALAPATAAAVVAGVVVGLAAGARKGALPALDGVLAGLMGGLMGPMTMAMMETHGQALVLGVVGWASGLGLVLTLAVIRGRVA